MGQYNISETIGESEMVQNIMKDVFFLSQKSEPATEIDRQVTLDAYHFDIICDEGRILITSNL